MQEDNGKPALLIIMDSLSGGGAEKVLINLLRYIDLSWNKITLLLLTGGGVHESKLPSGIELIKMEPCRNRLQYRLFFHLRRTKKAYFKHRLARLMKDRKFDVTVSYLEGQSMFAHSLLMNLSPRNVTFVHSDFSRFRFSDKYFVSKADEGKVYSQMDAVCFVSDEGRKGFEQVFGKRDNCFVVNNTIDVDEILAKSVEQTVERNGRFTIVTAARLIEVKRLDLMIESAAELKRRGQDFELWLLGEGHLKETLQNQARQLNVDDVVIFKGFQNNPYRYIKAADLFLLTSDAESFPTVVSEALCLEKPVVSTRVAGIDDQLGGRAGIVAERNSTAIANAVELIMSDKTKYDEYVEGARTQLAIFDPYRAAARFVSIVVGRDS